jgi:hypothetical protein
MITRIANALQTIFIVIANLLFHTCHLQTGSLRFARAEGYLAESALSINFLKMIDKVGGILGGRPSGADRHRYFVAGVS